MRQIFLDKRNIVVREVGQPLLQDYSVLVRVHYSFIASGSELNSLINTSHDPLFNNVPQKIKRVFESIANHEEGSAAAQGTIQSLGYSCSGTVIAVGKKVKTIAMGDLVACIGAGFAHHADIVCVPENLSVKIQNPDILKAASLTGLGVAALQGIRRSHIQLGEYVCVLGLGLLGQLTVQLAKRAGGYVIGVGPIAERVALAKASGADVVYRSTEVDLQKEIEVLTAHYGVDTTIITTMGRGSVLMQQAINITRTRGRIVLLTDTGLSVDRAQFRHKEIELVTSCSFGPGRHDPAYEQQGHDYPYGHVRWTENRNMQAFIDLLERKQVDVSKLIEAETNLDALDYAYEAIKKKRALGIVINYTSHTETSKNDDDFGQNTGFTVAETVTPEPRFVPAMKDKIRVGLVGVGNFARTQLMPLMARVKRAKITVVVDADAATALNASRVVGATRVLSRDTDLFEEDLVDAVIIASPHKFHCDQALRALHSGKAVFLEKPMATDEEQLARMQAFLTQHPQAPLCVDYNRSFSPFIQKIKAVVTTRHTPLIIQYRMNVGIIPKEHWIQTDRSAGRIIGQACHIIDLFCYLTDSKPLTVSVEALHTTIQHVFPTDNFCAQIRFADGSLCSLVYTSLGNEKLGTERMELFFDSKSIVMDNYEYLAGFGLLKSFDETVTMPDKGHEVLLNLFFEQLANATFEPPVSVDRLLTVARLTLIIDQLACEGGGSKEL